MTTPDTYVIPAPAAYVATYDTGRAKAVSRPVVAIAVGAAGGTALVLNLDGTLVRCDDEAVPGDFLGVTPTDWTE